MSDVVLRTLWISRLPHNLQAILVAHQDEYLDSRQRSPMQSSTHRNEELVRNMKNVGLPIVEDLISRIIAGVCLMMYERFTLYQLSQL